MLPGSESDNFQDGKVEPVSNVNRPFVGGVGRLLIRGGVLRAFKFDQFELGSREG